MLIASTGRGILVLVIWLVAAVLAVVLGILLLPVGTDAIWIMALCFLLSALGTYVLAQFGLSEAPHPSIDPKTGETVMVPQEHTFNGTKAKY